MNWTEIAGFVTGAVCVWLVVIRNIWNFPVGIANYVFFFVLFTQSGLYADAGLQVIYTGLALYGWYSWLYGAEDHSALTVHNPTPPQFIACLAAVGIIWAAIQFGLHRWTNSTVAGWDALTTALSLVAQFMLSRKWIANWWLWIAADLVYIPLYAYKGLWLTAGLYGIFLGMCIVGLIEWRRARSAPVPA
ncbi:MAG TPA: nicotinamide riboside transporter PnuC [Hyphomonas sp.]|nr:nicotinamide riboside transporter PnuC [Hyphomonas sp.]